MEALATHLRRPRVRVFLALLAFVSIGLYTHLSRDGTSAWVTPPPQHGWYAATSPRSRPGWKDGQGALETFVKGFPQLTLPHRRFGDDEAVASAKEVEVGNEGDYWTERVKDGRTAFDWATTGKLFVFGDSFSSSITESYRRQGVTDGHPKGKDAQTGLKWTDYLYSTFKDPAKTQYWNFARDGATIDLAVVPPRLSESGAFDDQFDEFKSLFTPMPGPAAVNWNSEDALFVILLGINDVREMARREFSPPALKRTATALPASLVARASKLYALGARNFLFFTLPALADAPKYALESGIGHNVSHILRSGTTHFNSALGPALDRFEDAHTQANAMVFDYENFYGVVSAWPEVFGLTDCSRFAVTVAGEKVDQGRMGMCFQDPSHPTWSIALLLARSVNGFLHRHSRSFWASKTTDTAIHA